MARSSMRAGRKERGAERLTPPSASDDPADDAEALLRSTLDALSAHVAVLDEHGTIVAVNEAWRSFGVATGYAAADHGVGMNYLAVCERSAAVSEEAERTACALREIMVGTRTSFRMEYPCMGPDGPRWFQLRVTCPSRSGRIVVAHEDITDVKLAEESLSRLNARLLRLQDEERRRIARELHDSTAQNLLAISLNAARLQDLARGGGGEQAARVASDILGLAEQSLQEIRTLSYLLHPPLLDDIGLESALRWLAKGFGDRSGITVEDRVDALGVPLPPDHATALFRVAQEALANVHRHSGSDWARLSLRLRGHAIELVVEDRGRGMAPGRGGDPRGPADEVGVGISGMRVRLEQLGGQLQIRSLKPGLRVAATLPLGAQCRDDDSRAAGRSTGKAGDRVGDGGRADLGDGLSGQGWPAC
jgi:two-component system, NarL family, sensor kinase